jgi:type I restriction-modification system DNA methylase subunit
METGDKVLSLKELDQHFNYIYSMINSEINMYENDLSFQVLSLIFLKRLYDTDSKIDGYSLNTMGWKKLRNVAAHAYKDFEYELKDELENVFKAFNARFAYATGIFDEINLTYTYNVESLVPVILFLDTIELSSKNVNDKDMGIAFEKLAMKLLSRQTSEFITDEAINQLAIEIIDVKLGESLYDPTMGIGGFHTSAYHKIRSESEEVNSVYMTIKSWSGQEINRKVFALCRMNLIMNGLTDMNVYLGDVIVKPQNYQGIQRTLFDKVICEIPVGKNTQIQYEKIRYDEFNRFIYGIPPQNAIQYGYIQHIISSIKIGGKAAIILPMKTLYSKGNEQKIRRNILEEDLIESVISLPHGLSKNSRLEMVLIVLNKDKPIYKKNRVLFIDLASNVTKLDESCIKFAVDIYRNFTQVKDWSIIAEISEIQGLKYDLNYKKYSQIFKDNQIILNEGKGRRIRDVVVNFPSISLYADKFHRQQVTYIRTKDLNKSITSRYLDLDRVEVKEVDKSYEVVRENSILVSLLGDNLKVTIVESITNTTVLDASIVSLVPNEDIIDFEYLYYQLYSPRVIQQSQALRTGTFPRISKNDFGDIVISVPSIELQKEYVRDQKLLLIEMEKIRYEEATKAIDIKESASDAEETVISILAHNTLPYIARIQYDINMVKRFMQENNLIDTFCNEQEVVEVEDEFGDISLEVRGNQNKEKLGEVVDRIEKVIGTFESIISETKKTVQLNLKSDDFKVVNLKTIFDEIRIEKMKDYIGRYDLEIDCPDILINIHKPSIKELFIQLLRNAEMHAFEFGDEKKRKKVIFKVEDRIDKVIINYSNNGKPFKISKEEYIKMGKKTQQSKGHGLGGAYIYRVVKAHGGNLHINKTSTGMKMEIQLSKGEDR